MFFQFKNQLIKLLLGFKMFQLKEPDSIREEGVSFHLLCLYLMPSERSTHLLLKFKQSCCQISGSHSREVGLCWSQEVFLAVGCRNGLSDRLDHPVPLSEKSDRWPWHIGESLMFYSYSYKALITICILKGFTFLKTDISFKSVLYFNKCIAFQYMYLWLIVLMWINWL